MTRKTGRQLRSQVVTRPCVLSRKQQYALKGCVMCMAWACYLPQVAGSPYARVAPEPCHLPPPHNASAHERLGGGLGESGDGLLPSTRQHANDSNDYSSLCMLLSAEAAAFSQVRPGRPSNPTQLRFLAGQGSAADSHSHNNNKISIMIMIIIL